MKNYKERNSKWGGRIFYAPDTTILAIESTKDNKSIIYLASMLLNDNLELDYKKRAVGSRYEASFIDIINDNPNSTFSEQTVL